MSTPDGPRFCTECGAPLPADAKFCGQCGTKVARPEASPAPAPAEPDVGFETLPPDLRAKFEAARQELRGERREVVVLFADVSGYTAMSERLDPEEVDDHEWVDWPSFRAGVLDGTRDVSVWCREQVAALPENPRSAPAGDPAQLPPAAR